MLVNYDKKRMGIMSIDDYWFDGSLYYVKFLTMDGRTISRDIIVPIGLAESMIDFIVMNSFKNVKKIVSIDFVSETLILKNRLSSFNLLTE